jgi:hypothetical protein
MDRLPAVAAPAFFPSVSKEEECLRGSMDSKTVYKWDSMDNQDKQNSLATLRETDNWVVWKTKNKTWTPTLKRKDFHQLLSFSKDEKENISGFKIKGWGRRGDLKVTKQKSTFECWVKSPTEAPREALDIIKTILTSPRQNYGKDSYIIDLDTPERTGILTRHGIRTPGSTLMGHVHLETAHAM